MQSSTVNGEHPFDRVHKANTTLLAKFLNRTNATESTLKQLGDHIAYKNANEFLIVRCQKLQAIIECINNLARERIPSEPLETLLFMFKDILKANFCTLYSIDGVNATVHISNLFKFDTTFPFTNVLGYSSLSRGSLANRFNQKSADNTAPNLSEHYADVHPDVRCFISCPILSEGGKLVAVVEFINTIEEKSNFDAEDEFILRLTSSLWNLFIKHIPEETNNHRKSQKFTDVFLQIAELCNANIDFADLVDRIVAIARILVPAEKAAVSISDSNRNEPWALDSKSGRVRLPKERGFTMNTTEGTSRISQCVNTFLKINISLLCSTSGWNGGRF